MEMSEAFEPKHTSQGFSFVDTILGMRAAFAVFLLAAAVSALNIALPDPVQRFSEMEQFKQYQVAHKKDYAPEEFSRRFENFKASLARVAARNREQPDAVFGLNKFSDMSVEEFRTSRLNYVRKPRSATYQVLRADRDFAPNVDWRTKNAVTPVKDQGDCGSCWAFSATEEVESMWALKNGTLNVFAPQQVVSCDTVDGACDGGDTITAYAYIKSAHGLVSEKDYPYTSGNTGVRGRCHYNHGDVKAPVSGYVYATPPCDSGSCNSQKPDGVATQLSNTGPISICVAADSWQDYNSGILRSNCPHGSDDLDHCVQLVGMTDQYWLIRNSWNTDWGEEGYIRVAKSPNNLCGILDEATIVHFA